MKDEDPVEINMGTAYDSGFYNGRDVGRREVVEWVESNRLPNKENDGDKILLSHWQAKLKEWGL